MISQFYAAKMKKMNENMAELIAVKKQKMEQSPVFYVPYFQQSPSQASSKQVEPACNKHRETGILLQMHLPAVLARLPTVGIVFYPHKIE